ncbi:MAG TPA: GPW/gp25 family protein [Pyrinomonadaceae bacterium]|nr:GPW/gp25 family protein [Pyrinomonadaceae bacterium]
MTRSFLGRGWKFPVGVDPATGRIAMSEHEQDIREAIRIILATALGERVMRPDFGCGIHELVFSTISRATTGLFESRVREAIMKWEARVELVQFDISTRDAAKGKLEIQMTCRVRDTNNEFNLVFPFYLTEGTG